MNREVVVLVVANKLVVKTLPAVRLTSRSLDAIVRASMFKRLVVNGRKARLIYVKEGRGFFRVKDTYSKHHFYLGRCYVHVTPPEHPTDRPSTHSVQRERGTQTTVKVVGSLVDRRG